MAFLIINVWKFAQGLQPSSTTQLWNSAQQAHSTGTQQYILSLCSCSWPAIIISFFLCSALAWHWLRLPPLYQALAPSTTECTVAAVRCRALCAAHRAVGSGPLPPWRVSAEAALAPQSRRRRRRRCWPWNCRQCSRSAWIRRPRCCCCRRCYYCCHSEESKKTAVTAARLLQASHKSQWRNFLLSLSIHNTYITYRYCRYNVEGGWKKSRQAQNLAISRKSTILIRSSWYSSNKTYSWDDYFHQVS